MNTANRSQAAAQATDFVVYGGGSIYLIHSLTEAGRNHLVRVVGEEAQFFGNAVALEHRYVADFLAALAADGFAVAGEG